MQPVQPLYTDDSGVVRFHPNKIVRYLLDNGGIDMNKIAMLPDIPREDREQFAQLIGYSLGGFGDLSYCTDATYAAAESQEVDPKIAYKTGFTDGELSMKQRVQRRLDDIFEEEYG